MSTVEISAFPGVGAIARREHGRDLLERLVVTERAAAAVLRAHGHADAARRAERFAARIRLTLDQPQLSRRMLALTRRLYEAPAPALLYERALDGAMSLLRSDFGNVQLCDPTRGSLRIAAEHGFSSEFLDYFAAVDDDASACGRAARQRRATVIADVNHDPRFAPHRQIAAAAGFRAVQSTPLIDRGGRLRGVISTHFRSRRQPSRDELLLIGWYAEHVAAAMAAPAPGATTVDDHLGALHERIAAQHEASAGRHERTAGALLADGQDATGAEIRARARAARARARRERERAEAATLLARIS